MKSLLKTINEFLEKELINEDIQKLPSDIYLEIVNYVKETKNISEENNVDLISKLLRRERDLIIEVTTRLLKKRLNKIKKNNELINNTNLTSEEKYLIEPSSISEKRFKKIKSALTYGNTAFIRNISDIIFSRYIIVKFLQSSSSIIGIDLKKYGPFKKDDVAVLPLENAEPLLEQKIVQEIDIDM